MMNTYPFQGKGIAFPFRISESTGGVVTSYGISDPGSVALQFIYEKWTIRRNPYNKVNHIAESIAHILLTTPTEHDTLPEFGSYIYKVLFEPNTYEFRSMYEIYLQESIKRWEKRVKVPSNNGVMWHVDGRIIDSGEAPVFVEIMFEINQVRGNLVQPFVDDRESRLEEYKSNNLDQAGHDSYSRYFNRPLVALDDYQYSRIGHRRSYAITNSDHFYKVKRGDTWLSIAWELYREIRLWYIIAACYIDDNQDADRALMSPLSDPPVGALLRAPSKPTVLMGFPGGY